MMPLHSQQPMIWQFVMRLRQPVSNSSTKTAEGPGYGGGNNSKREKRSLHKTNQTSLRRTRQSSCAAPSDSTKRVEATWTRLRKATVAGKSAPYGGKE